MRGSVVLLALPFGSRTSFLQDLLVEGQFGHGLAQPGALPLKILRSLRLIDPEAAILAAPPVVALLGYTQTPAHLTDRLALGQGNLGLSKHIDDLFGLACLAPSSCRRRHGGPVRTV